MSTIEKQWKVVLDLLQCMTAGQFKTPAAADAILKAMDLLEPIVRQGATPARTLTKLVVGFKVGSSCSLSQLTLVHLVACNKGKAAMCTMQHH